MSALEQHPLSAAFPSMPEDELRALAGDIKAHGLHSAIVIYKGQVLDGWHRYRACILAGVNPRTMEYKGNDPVAFVKSANWHRRHMTESQRAMTQVALSEWREPGRQNNRATIAQLPPTSAGMGDTVAPMAPTVADMAKDAGVSERSIQRAKTVEAKGTEAVKAAVREGSIPVHIAAEIATLPKREQNKVLAEPNVAQPVPAKKPAPATVPAEKYNALAEQFEEMESNYRVIADELATVEELRNGDPAKAMTLLREEIRQLKQRRDDLMTENAELKRQVVMLRKQAQRAERKVAK